MATPLDQQLAPTEGWQKPAKQRLAPMTKAESNFFQRLISFLIVKVFKVKAPNLFMTGLRNTRVFLPMLIYNQQMMPRGECDRRDTELAILRVAWRCRSLYEWGQHVEIGLRAGLEADEISRVPLGPDAAGWTPLQAAILRAVDELHEHKIVSDETWLQLSVRYQARQLFELLAVIQHYSGLAGLLNSFGVELDQPIADALADTPIHRSAVEKAELEQE